MSLCFQFFSYLFVKMDIKMNSLMFLSSILAFQKCPGSRFRLPDQLQKLIITS